MAKRISVSVAREVAKKTGARQVILLAWDGASTYVVTYGITVEDCAQAAAGGNILKEKWGWPECNDQPPRMKRLLSLLKEVAEKLAAAKVEYVDGWRATKRIEFGTVRDDEIRIMAKQLVK
jgi:hypothetical protein